MLKSPIVPSAAVPGESHRFVGRDTDIPTLARAFEAGQHVVLWGIGGIGKTSLALHMAQRQGWRFPDGTAFHSCEASPCSIRSWLPWRRSCRSYRPGRGCRRPSDGRGERRLPRPGLPADRRQLRDRQRDRQFSPVHRRAAPGYGGAHHDAGSGAGARLAGARLLPLPTPETLRLLSSLLPADFIAQQSERSIQAFLAQVGGHPMAIELAAALAARDRMDLGAGRCPGRTPGNLAGRYAASGTGTAA
ncbi:MAG: ATP-binding protein [Anaerolineae bacterium]|nr:MAG: ATP-binding protein [Anaerolineae bacterium]